MTVKRIQLNMSTENSADAEVEDILLQARCRLTHRHPWYGTIVMAMDWKADDMLWIPEPERRTMGVSMMQGGKILCRYNPAWCKTKTLRQLFGIIMHEIEHIVRLHPIRCAMRNPMGWNIAADMTCLKPDELIIAETPTPIKNIGVGDKVYGKDGKLTEVVRVMKRCHSGKMVQIKARYVLPFETTPEHPILVVKWKLKTTSNPKTTIKVYSEPEFVPASELVGNGSYRNVRGDIARSGYSLVLPKTRLTKIDNLSLNEFIERPCDGSIKNEKLNLTIDTMWLMGLFVAEGSLTNANFNGIQFSLGSHEEKIHEKLVGIIDRLGYKPAKYVSGTTCKITLNSPIIARAFIKFFGRGAKNKKLPAWLMSMNDVDLVKHFIAGMIDGDGSDHRNGVVLDTASKTLALQIQQLCFNHGLPIGIRHVKQKCGRMIGKTVLPDGDLYRLSMFSYQFNEAVYGEQRNRKHSYYYDAGESIYLPISMVNETDYDGDVHNIETKNNTYVVNNVVVHNCNGKKKDPRIGYPVNGKLAFPMNDAIFIPDDWDDNSTAEQFYEKLEKNSKTSHCKMCGRTTKTYKIGPDKNKGQGQQGQGQGKNKSDQGQDDGSGQGGGCGSDPGDGGCGGSTQEGQCPGCGQEKDGKDRFGGFEGQTLDSHEVWSHSDAPEDEARQYVKDLVRRATENNRGVAPGHMKSAIEELNKPVVKWRELLRIYLGKHCGNKRHTYARRNRRYRQFGIKGESHHAAATATVIVDTSGSISTEEIQQFFGEIESILYRTTVTLVQCDAVVHHCAKYKRGDWRKIEVKGRGGTNMVAAYDYIEKNNVVGDVVILLTDGETPWPDDRGYPSIFVITRAPTGPKWGHSIFINKNNYETSDLADDTI